MLVRKWHGGPIDPANGIYGPADVAGHWREVGEHSRMPIDGSLIIDNPVQSSFPPSRVFKIIQKHHGEEKAFEYLRRAREDLFAFNKNICEGSVLVEIVNQLGLDGEGIVREANEQTGHDLLNEDALTRNLGARGFPTIIMVNEENKGVKIGGGRPFENYVSGLTQVLGKNRNQHNNRRYPLCLKKRSFFSQKKLKSCTMLKKRKLMNLSKENFHQFVIRKKITRRILFYDYRITRCRTTNNPF